MFSPSYFYVSVSIKTPESDSLSLRTPCNSLQQRDTRARAYVYIRVFE